MAASLPEALWFAKSEVRQAFRAHPTLFFLEIMKGMKKTLWSPGTLFFRKYLGFGNNLWREVIKIYGIFYLAVCYPAVITGIAWAGYHRRLSIEWVLICGIILYFVFLSSSPASYYRFRVPFWPLICLLTGGPLIGRRSSTG